MAGLGPFDVVFIDPPFRMAQNGPEQRRLLELLSNLFSSGELAADAVVILRTPKHGFFPKAPPGIALTDKRAYGNSCLLFFEAPPESPVETEDDAPPEASRTEEVNG
jgi:16S rRNA G966 N2-methylase RsmD